MSKKPVAPDTSDTALLKQAVGFLDDLLVLSNLYRQDFFIVHDALTLIARVTQRYPGEIGLTVSLVNFMRENGYLEPKE